MRIRVVLGILVLLTSTLSASAQVSVSGGITGMPGGGAIQSGSPTFFAGPLAKPDFSAMSQKAAFLPAAPSFSNMAPSSWSGLQNTMLLRNFFNGPSMGVTIWPTPTPPVQTQRKRFNLWP